MEKKLPNIYKASDCSRIRNNKTVFNFDYNSFDTRSDEEKKQEANNIDYVFNTPVTIKTAEETIKTKIVGKLDDHILTSDNRIIKLKDIESIKI